MDEICLNCVKPFVVGIGGASNSGKTTLAIALRQHYCSYSDISPKQKQKELPKGPRMFSGCESPDVINWNEYNSALQSEIQKSTIFCSKHNQQTGKDQRPIKGYKPQLLFTEGFLIFSNANPKQQIQHYFNARILICISKNVCHERRMKTCPCSEAYFQQSLWPSYVYEHRKLLDSFGNQQSASNTNQISTLIINGELDFNQVLNQSKLFIDTLRNNQTSWEPNPDLNLLIHSIDS